VRERAHARAREKEIETEKEKKKRERGWKKNETEKERAIQSGIEGERERERDSHHLWRSSERCLKDSLARSKSLFVFSRMSDWYGYKEQQYMYICVPHFAFFSMPD